MSLDIDNFCVRPMQKNSSFLDRIQNTIKSYLFVYPQREEVDLHLSIIDAKGLFVIRVISFLYLTAVYVWQLVIFMTSFFLNIQYLTQIGYTLTWLYFTLVLQDYYLNAKKTLNQRKAHSLKLHIEILYQMAFCLELPITVVFWTILFKIVLGLPEVTLEIIILNANLHAGPFICLAVQFFFNKYSFPRHHFLPIGIVAIVYLIINLIYTLQVSPIYRPITWIDWQSYILSLGCIGISFLLHFICRIVYRKWKIKKIMKANESQARLLVPLKEDGVQSRRESVEQNDIFQKTRNL